MDEKRDNQISTQEESSSAYRDALYAQASGERRNSYGYNPAQCYARVREEEEPSGGKRHGGGLIAVTAVLIVGVMIAALLGSGGLFLANRASAAGAADEEAMSREIMDKLHHGVTVIPAKGMYSGTDLSMIVCIINKHQIAKLRAIIHSYPGTFANVTQADEIFGNFKTVK